MKKLIVQIIAAWVGIWLATILMPNKIFLLLSPDSNFFGTRITELWQLYLIISIILGLLNFFVKPVLKLISLPLEIITFGLFSVAINMGLIWIVDGIFNELHIKLFFPLFWTSMLIWVSNIIIKKIIIVDED